MKFIPLIVLVGITTACGRAQPAPPVNDCARHKHYGRLNEARACYEKLAANSNPAVRAEGYWGLEMYQDANNQFRAAVARDPKNADVRVRWGRMFLERFQNADAAKLFQEALEIQESHSGALLGLAMVAAESYEKKAVELAEQAAKQSPKLVEARELLARLALEDSDAEKARKQAEEALAVDSESLDAMAVLASIDLLNERANPASLNSEWFAKILRINPVYGEAWSTAGHFFVINRRYEEGIKLYQKAVELNPKLWEARAELGVNLMRLGAEDEARKQLEIAYENNYKSPAVVNTLRLMDSYKNFVSFKTPTTVVRLNKKEAELLRPYIEGELLRAMATYDKKYKVKLEGPVQVEVYPDHEDFAVRTMGLPGLGALGVTFGNVVAMDSPSGRKPGSFHWASTLWHELSHVYVLSATKHRVPRWFTEGMAVHEETAVAPDWGDRLDAEAIMAIQKNKLLPIAELDRGFVRPSYPSQVVVSYFQAGRVCDYIASKWGYDRLLAMMHSFAEMKTTPQVIEQHLGMKPEAFDKEFLAWLSAQTKTQVNNFEDWKKRLRVVAAASKAERWDEVIKEGTAIRDLYPDYVEAGSVYEFLAEAYDKKGDKAASMAELARYSKIGGRYPPTLKKLAKMQQEAGRKQEAAATLERLLFIYPVQDEELHRTLGDLYMEMGRHPRAIREYAAVVALKPVDLAAAHFNLARAYRADRKNDEAKDQVLLALEAAPGFKPAQKLLLELSDSQKDK